MSKKAGVRGSRKARGATKRDRPKAIADAARPHKPKTMEEWFAAMDSIPRKFPKRGKQPKQSKRHEII